MRQLVGRSNWFNCDLLSLALLVLRLDPLKLLIKVIVVIVVFLFLLLLRFELGLHIHLTRGLTPFVKVGYLLFPLVVVAL